MIAAPAISRAALWDALLTVEDPELGVDVVNLGLVRDLALVGAEVHLTMTLTSVACPLAEELEARLQTVLGDVPGVDQVRVEFTFDPPWSPAAITEEGRDQLMALGYI